MAEPAPEHLLAPPAPEQVPAIPPYVEITQGRGPTPPPVPSTRPVRGLWICGALILAAGLAGLAYLSFHFRADTAPASHVPLPGTDLVIDKPAGWSAQDLSDAPDLVGLFLDDEGAPSQGLVLRRGDASIFVAHVPNSTGLQAIPQLPAAVGDLRVESQHETAHALGSGRSVVVEGDANGEPVASETTLLLVEDRILVVGVLAPRALSPAEVATVRAVTSSLRRD